MQIQKRKTRFLAAVLSLGTVAGAVAGSALLSPAPSASADGGSIGNDNASTQVQLNLLPMLSVAVDDFAIDITPDSDGVYATDTQHVLVDSNAASGYKVYLSTSTSTTALKQPTSTGITKTIDAVGGDVAVSAYTSDSDYNNTWGYVHDDKISAIPYDSSLLTACDSIEDVEECFAAQRTAASSSVKICESATSNYYAGKAAGDTTSGTGTNYPECTLTIGVKADNSLPSGDYSNTIVITAVPNE